MSEVYSKSDRYTQMLSQLGMKYFIDKDFIITMRASELNGPEEFDNSMAYALWHGFLEGGIQQMKLYVDGIEKVKRDKEQWIKVPEDQKERIEELLKRFKQFDDSKPVDDKDNIRIIRNYLADYNENLVDGIVMYDLHYSILNGRFAKGRGGKREVLEISKTALQRDFDIQVAERRAEDDRSFLDKVMRRKKQEI